MTRKNIQTIQAAKGKEKIVVLTAYTAPVARILDRYCDILLVGDSLGMVLYGFDSTLPVTLEMMIQHGRAVVTHSEKALVVVDLPFGSYEESPEQALENSRRILQETGAQAIKLEGGQEMAATIRHLTQHGVTVMAHIGLLPQHIEELGGYKVQGRTEAERARILADAKAVEEAGAFAIVIEATQEDVACAATTLVNIPTIGIGASEACDGQVLVVDDMAGLSGANYKFVRQFGDMAAELDKAARDYAAAVRSGEFPAKDHVFGKK